MISRLEVKYSGNLAADVNGCHTIFQVLSGGSIGIILGFLWFYIYKKLEHSR